jgi:signal transduction histidine kinase
MPAARPPRRHRTTRHHDTAPWAIATAPRPTPCDLIAQRNQRPSTQHRLPRYCTGPEISGSPSQINQVFLNLIANAAQAMPERDTPNIITLRTSIAPEEHMVLIEIQDNGSGIPEEVLPRIFDPFYTTKPIGQGSGMGLSISFKIIQEHGGRILIDTVKDAGTVFTILLPLSNAATTPEKAANSADALFSD